MSLRGKAAMGIGEFSSNSIVIWLPLMTARDSKIMTCGLFSIMIGLMQTSTMD